MRELALLDLEHPVTNLKTHAIPDFLRKTHSKNLGMGEETALAVGMRELHLLDPEHPITHLKIRVHGLDLGNNSAPPHTDPLQVTNTVRLSAIHTRLSIQTE